MLVPGKREERMKKDSTRGEYADLHAACGGCSTEIKKQNPPPTRAGKRKEKRRRRYKKQTEYGETKRKGKTEICKRERKNEEKGEKGKGKGVRAAPRGDASRR